MKVPHLKNLMKLDCSQSGDLGGQGKEWPDFSLSIYTFRIWNYVNILSEQNLT